MKKAVFLLSICLLTAMLVTLALPAFAVEKDFVADYFPAGKPQTPDAPYIKETQFDGQDTQLTMYYYQTADLQKLALDLQQTDEITFCENYGMAQLSKFYQIDAKFNDGEWLSSKGNWDKVNEGDWQDYGENMNAANLNFLLEDMRGNDNADKLLSFAQSWITYFEADNPENDFFKPFVKLTDKDGEQIKTFDFAETTIAYRIRSVVRYKIHPYEENEQWVVLTSDWSPEISYGKNGKQTELKMPEKPEAPVLSEFKLSANEDGSGEITFFASLHDSTYEAERYQLIVNNGFEPYYIDAEVKINDGDWFRVGVKNEVWLNNGYRSSWISDEQQLKAADDAWIRVRICNHDDDSAFTEWSNIIGTKAPEGTEDTTEPVQKPTGEPASPAATQEAKCKICGFCPIQPLGICLFIWLAIILVIILVAVILIASAKKKKNKR